MVDFISMGLLRILQNEKFLPTLGFEPGVFRFRKEQKRTRLALR